MTSFRHADCHLGDFRRRDENGRYLGDALGRLSHAVFVPFILVLMGLGAIFTLSSGSAAPLAISRLPVLSLTSPSQPASTSNHVLRSTNLSAIFMRILTSPSPLPSPPGGVGQHNSG